MSSTGSMTLPVVASTRRGRSARRARSRSGSRGRKVLNPVTGRMVKVGGRAYRKAHGLVKPRRKASRTARKARRSPKKMVARSPRRRMASRSPRRRVASRSPRRRVASRSPKKHVAKLSPRVRRGRLAGGSVLRCRVMRKTRSPKKM
jgi:hypothetical protein